MDRLSVLLTLMTGAVLTGGLVVVLFSFGLYGWIPILGSAAVGFVLSWPVAYLVSRRIKRRDPNWPDGRNRADAGRLPDPAGPEI